MGPQWGQNSTRFRSPLGVRRDDAVQLSPWQGPRVPRDHRYLHSSHPDVSIILGKYAVTLSGGDTLYTPKASGRCLTSITAEAPGEVSNRLTITFKDMDTKWAATRKS